MYLPESRVEYKSRAHSLITVVDRSLIFYFSLTSSLNRRVIVVEPSNCLLLVLWHLLLLLVETLLLIFISTLLLLLLLLDVLLVIKMMDSLRLWHWLRVWLSVDLRLLLRCRPHELLLCWRSKGPLPGVNFLVLSERQEHTVFSESDLEVVREIAEFIPLAHLLLLKRTSHYAAGVLVEPFALEWVLPC
jgi:hypothetical protein